MKILITDGMAEEAVDMFKKTGHEVVLDEASPERLLEIIGEYDALCVRSRTKVRKEVIDRAVRLKVIGRAGIGVDNIDIDYAREKGIKVVNAPTGSTLSVAELTMGHMIALARGIVQGTQGIREGKWLKKQLKGRELAGKTLGIIGCGRIGREVAKRAQAFGMNVIGCDPYLPKDAAEKARIELTDMDHLLRNADFITIHANLTPENYHMINRDAFEKMKKSAYIINCARGGIIDENDLYHALKDGKIAGAALDTFENEPPGETPLAELDNVIFTPHIGANTVEAQVKAGTIVAEQVLMALEGKEPVHWVNKP